MKKKTARQLWASLDVGMWEDFCRIADIMRTRDRSEAWSARACIDIMRWERGNQGKSAHKVANDLTPLLGRKYNQRVGEVFFRVRKASCDRELE